MRLSWEFEIWYGWFKQSLSIHRNHKFNKQQVLETQKQYAYAYVCLAYKSKYTYLQIYYCKMEFQIILKTNQKVKQDRKQKVQHNKTGGGGVGGSGNELNS